jgi:hypothetical protein
MMCGAGAVSFYVDLPPAMNSLQVMDGSHGYWVHALDAAQLEVAGHLLPESQGMALCAGYNLVSYLPDAALPVADALASIAGQYDAVMGFDPITGAESYYPDLPAGLNSLKVMQPGRGYWIHMLASDTLYYPNP